jgi:hypothetical protein
MQIGIKAMQWFWVITLLLVSATFGQSQILRKVPKRAGAVPGLLTTKRDAQIEHWIGASPFEASRVETAKIEAGNRLSSSSTSSPGKASGERKQGSGALQSTQKSFDGPPYIPVSPQRVAELVYASAVADFDHVNGANIVDLESDGTLNIFLNDGKGGFSQTYSIPTGQTGCRQSFLRAVDLNADGYADIVGMDVYQSKLFIFLNDGTGHIKPPPQ